MKSFRALLTVAASAVSALPHLQSDSLPIAANDVQRATPRNPSTDIEVPGSFPLHRSRDPRILARRAVSQAAARQGIGISPTYTHNLGITYYTPIKIGTQVFNLTFDTGSSDTWLAASDYRCFDPDTNATLPRSTCRLGELFTPGPDFAIIEDQNFNIPFYGDGSAVNGQFGKIDITLGGITVNAQIGLVHNAYWPSGDDVMTGFLGLAYPSITQAFSGTDITKDNGTLNQVPYDPIFFKMWKENLIKPFFSIAISRQSIDPLSTAPDGHLAFGRLPPEATVGKWAKAPIEYVLDPADNIPSILPFPQYQFYTFTPDAYLVKGSHTLSCRNDGWAPIPTGNLSIQATLDSGATNIYLPPPMAAAVLALYSPPAVWDPVREFYAIPCDAKAPDFAVQIGGVVFVIDKRDMILDDTTGRGLCQTGVIDGHNTIGDVFLKNVVAVFDVGKTELRFKARAKY